MRKLSTVLFAALVVSALATSNASAQRRYGRETSRPIELGMDAGVSIGLDEPKVTTVGLPFRAFRVGFFFADNLSLEPAFGLTSVHVNDDTFTTYEAALGLLLHLAPERTGSGIYVRPFAGVVGVSGGGDSDSNGFLGAGVGVKIPWGDRRLATRLEGNFSHSFEGDGTNAIGLLVGLSFFTR